MYIDLKQLSANAAYFITTQTLIPRPIAWVLSEHKSGQFNIAPFSYFTSISSNPPLLLIAAGKKNDGSPKDSRANIEKRGKFVIHIASMEQMQALNDSAATLAPEISEIDKFNIELCDFEGFDLPRVKDCPIAFACDLYQIQEIGNTPQALILGQIQQIYINDDCASTDKQGRVKVEAKTVNPLGRLGSGEYCNIGDIIKLKRPLWLFKNV